MANQRKPETIEADEAAGEIRRFSMADMPDWGTWLANRLALRYRNFNRAGWPARANMAMMANDVLFIRNERAALMLRMTPRGMDGSLIAIEDFCLSRDAEVQPDGDYGLPGRRDPIHRPLILLYNAARDWARSQKAQRLFVGQCSDLPYGKIREIMHCDPSGWLSVPL